MIERLLIEHGWIRTKPEAGWQAADSDDSLASSQVGIDITIPAWLSSGRCMTADKKIELKRLTGWLVGIWISYLVFVPQIYPPRSLTIVDYVFMVLIPTGAFFSVRPGVSWRWLLYYGVFASLPFTLALMEKLQINFNIRSHFSQPSVSMIYSPCLGLFAVLVVVAIVAGMAGRVIKTNKSKASF